MLKRSWYFFYSSHFCLFRFRKQHNSCFFLSAFALHAATVGPRCLCMKCILRFVVCFVVSRVFLLLFRHPFSFRCSFTTVSARPPCAIWCSRIKTWIYVVISRVATNTPPALVRFVAAFPSIDISSYFVSNNRPYLVSANAPPWWLILKSLFARENNRMRKLSHFTVFYAKIAFGHQHLFQFYLRWMFVLRLQAKQNIKSTQI